MSDILTKKIYSKDKDTGTETQVYPETSMGAVIGLTDALSAKANVADIPNVTNFVRADEVMSIVANNGELPSRHLTGFDFTSDVSSLDGKYYVTNAVNSPFNGEDGFLEVAQDADCTLERWSSENYTAYRLLGEVNPVEAKISSLTINGTAIDTNVTAAETEVAGVAVNTNAVIVNKLDNGSEVVLTAGGTYTISGCLINTRIRVTAGLATDVTTINLNGLYIYFNNKIDVEDEDNLEKRVKGWEPMILVDAIGTTTINLVEGSKNYLIREKEETMPAPDEDGLYGLNHSTAVIYSSGGAETLEITGSGYLSIKSMLGGHAIKAKGNLVVSGSPKIRATCYHDVLHGNASVLVTGGYVFCDWCNDFFGADTADGDQAVGLITLKSGEFYVKFCKETFLQCDNARIYPAVKITYEHIGEGLWLQCKAGTRLFVEDGKVKGYYTLDYTNHTFSFVNAKKKKMPGSEFWNLLQFAEAADPYATLQAAADTTQTNSAVYGIILYEGVSARCFGPTTAPDYVESDRNTPRADAAAAEQAVPNEELVPAMAALDNSVFPTTEVVEYTGTVYGGNWVIYIRESKLTSEKNAINKNIASVLSDIIPPKALLPRVKLGNTLLEQDDNNTYFIAPTPITTELADDPTKGESDRTYHGVKAGKEVFTSKTGNVPVITIHKGEWARIYANLDPVDATNGALKWSIAEENENTVIFIRKSEDTKYCDVLGIDPGSVNGQDEAVVLTAKALDKNGAIIKAKVRFHVIPEDAGYTPTALPVEKTEVDVLREQLAALVARVEILEAQSEPEPTGE